MNWLNFLSYENRVKHQSAPLWFAVFLALQLTSILVVVWYFFPSTWHQHVSSGLWSVVLTCLVCNFLICFGEYFFHRYLLHIESVRFLRHFTTSHRKHHKLTSIVFDDTKKTVRSKYPICNVERDEQSTFPPWALIPTFVTFTPFFASVAFSFPEIPILIGGYTAIAIALFLYETIHVVHHQPYDTWWKPKLRSGIFATFWRKAYGFHQAHHANYQCNQNVAGFFGIPLADLVFRTYRQPTQLFLTGAPATKETARRLTPQPRWPIAWLDQVVLKRRRWMSKTN